jgi:hypothetical protein
LEGGLDQATDDLGAADRFSVLETDIDGQTVEISDMPVEEYDSNLCPGLGVDDGSSAVALSSWTHTHLSGLKLDRTVS